MKQFYLLAPPYTYLNKGNIHNEGHDLDEISGIVSSKSHPGILYAINDKGDSAKVYAIDTTNNNNLAATFHLRNADNYDWEDLAYGKCDISNYRSPYCIYIGTFL